MKWFQNKTVQILTVALITFVGFRLVTQSGLEGYEGSLQNDGYAVAGGIVIFLAGYLTAKWSNRRSK